MSRRSTPERIDEARRAATRNRLIGERVSPETADAWIAAWEAQAAQDGRERGAAYWGKQAGRGSPSSDGAGCDPRNGCLFVAGRLTHQASARSYN
jgi:hypothetical protein